LILIDANLLIYAVNSGAFQHAAAQQWLDESKHGQASQRKWSPC